MNNTDNKNEVIELTLPLNSAYVSAARLTASSIANRLKFDIDEIEDIKVAVSEACIYLIKQFSSEAKNSFKILFTIDEKTLKVDLLMETIKKTDLSNDMSIIMIKALMDNLDVECKPENILKLTMLKNHKQYSFEE